MKLMDLTICSRSIHTASEVTASVHILRSTQVFLSSVRYLRIQVIDPSYVHIVVSARLRYRSAVLSTGQEILPGGSRCSARCPSSLPVEAVRSEHAPSEVQIFTFARLGCCSRLLDIGGGHDSGGSG